jgi:hypothetical protein
MSHGRSMRSMNTTISIVHAQAVQADRARGKRR